MSSLEQWRNKYNVSQEALAEMLGCSRPTVSLIESENKATRLRRRPSPELAAKIEEITHGEVSAAELLAHLVPPGYELRRIDTEAVSCECPHCPQKGEPNAD
jgi:transcriptional regulator with XRE-family HTH domain